MLCAKFPIDISPSFLYSCDLSIIDFSYILAKVQCVRYSACNASPIRVDWKTILRIVIDIYIYRLQILNRLLNFTVLEYKVLTNLFTKINFRLKTELLCRFFRMNDQFQSGHLICLQSIQSFLYPRKTIRKNLDFVWLQLFN